MGGYGRDEYENWDEYEEEDGEEQEEEEEGGEDGYGEEDQQLMQEQLGYLELRQKLKERIRKQMKKELGTASGGSRDKLNGFRNDNFGSFFGPSQPVIAQRVIQESRSLLENPDLAARISKRPNNSNNKNSASAPVRSNSGANHRPTVANAEKKKVEILKNTRDYSFLLSEDAEVPASSKSPPPRNVSAPKPDARSAQLLARNNQVVHDRGRDDRGREVVDRRDGRKPMLSSSQSKQKLGLGKTASSSRLSMESRKQLGSNNGSGPGRPSGPKGVPSKSPTRAIGKTTPAVPKATIASGHKPTPSGMQGAVRKPAPSHLQSGSHRQAPLRSQPLLPKKPSVQREYKESGKPKPMAKQPLPPSREQVKRPPPKLPPRGNSVDARPKSKPKRQLHDEDSDGEEAISMIRKMFGYNPKKFRDYDDDDRNMEAGFDDIMREESRSARIARQEDEEQLRLIEEEEKRERMRAKKRRLGH